MDEEEKIAIYTRLALLEERDERDRKLNADAFEEVNHKVDSVDDKLDKLLLRFEKYEGKLGGIILAFSLIGIFIKLSWNHIIAWFTTKGG